GWSGPVFATLSVGGIPVPIVPEEIWFLLRVYLLAAVFVVLSSSVPRVRIDQILNIGWKRLIPYSLLAVLVAAGFRVLGWGRCRPPDASEGGPDAVAVDWELIAFFIL